MIRIQGKLPTEFIVACSAGVDSMSVLDFVRRKHTVTALYVNHRTPQSKEMQECVEQYCLEQDIPLAIECISESAQSVGKSPEEYWRDERYRIINTVSESFGMPVITCHHLDDCVETWIWSSMHGNPKIIPYNRGNSVIRPFLLTPKRVLKGWAEKYDVPYVEDSSNSEMKYTRNYVRHVCVPHVKHINPGIEKTITKKVLSSGPA